MAPFTQFGVLSRQPRAQPNSFPNPPRPHPSWMDLSYSSPYSSSHSSLSFQSSQSSALAAPQKIPPPSKPNSALSANKFASSPLGSLRLNALSPIRLRQDWNLPRHRPLQLLSLSLQTRSRLFPLLHHHRLTRLRYRRRPFPKRAPLLRHRRSNLRHNHHRAPRHPAPRQHLPSSSPPPNAIGLTSKSVSAQIGSTKSALPPSSLVSHCF